MIKDHFSWEKWFDATSKATQAACFTHTHLRLGAAPVTRPRPRRRRRVCFPQTEGKIALSNLEYPSKPPASGIYPDSRGRFRICLLFGISLQLYVCCLIAGLVRHQLDARIDSRALSHVMAGRLGTGNWWVRVIVSSWAGMLGCSTRCLSEATARQAIKISMRRPLWPLLSPSLVD